MSHDIPPNPTLGASLTRLARGYTPSEGDRIAVPWLESPFSCFNRPLHMAVRMSICFCSLALSAIRVDLETKAKAFAPMIWVN
jgi:hypothetical protein